MTSTPGVIIVGAGPAGLACAATMRAAGLSVTVLERADNVGSAWRRHYDRLHLHTDRNHSGLPGMPMPSSYPTYPSRAQVVAYLESYAARFDIRPLFNTEVAQIGRADGQWRVDCAQGPIVAPVVVVATGMASAPYRPSWPGEETYQKPIVHSSEYRNPAPYAGKRVLVVGFGNSGGEIALDLAEAGVDVALSVRGPVQVIPRDLLGFPILSWVILYRRLPARLVDRMNAPILRLALGNIEKLGLQLAAKGPREMVERDGRVPLIDVGTLARIKDGTIRLRGGIARFAADSIVFTDAKEEAFDAVILATGFRPDLRRLLPDADGVLDKHGAPLVKGACDPRARPLFLWSDHLADRAAQGDRHRSEADRGIGCGPYRPAWLIPASGCGRRHLPIDMGRPSRKNAFRSTVANDRWHPSPSILAQN